MRAYEFIVNISEMAAIHWNTPEFKKWFQGSKMVNADGSPKVMYHGTGFDIKKFHSYRHNMYYFTDNQRVAGGYAMDTADNWDSQGNYDDETGRYETHGGANIIPVYLNVKNTYDTMNRSHVLKVAEFVGKKHPNLSDEKCLEVAANGEYDNIEDFLLPFIMESGFDSVWVKEFPDTKPQDRDIAVFRRNQIKSAVGNIGKYDPDSDYISD